MTFDWKSLNPFYKGSKHDEGEPIWPSIKSWISDRWKDITGQTAIDVQNQKNMELAKYQSQLNEDFYNKYSSPEALMRQYREAGLNPNLVYGSASSGQSNVPSFNAPTIQRNMSGSEKLSKALSMISQIAGVMQGVYQTSAAKESAQQAAVRTMSDVVSYKRNALDYGLQSDLLGASIGTPSTKLFRKRNNGINFVSAGDIYDRYLGAYREYKFNDFALPVFRNYYDYGKMYDKNGNVLNSKLTPYMQTRNLFNDLRYRLADDLGNKGVYGKLAIGLLNTIF